MPPTDVRMSIIVATFQRPKAVRRLLDRLAPQLRSRSAEVELIVVDDGSEPQVRDSLRQEIAARQDQLPIRLELLPSNRGPAAARNHGIAVSQGEILAFLDDDILPKEDYLEQTLHFFASRPNVLVAVGHLTPMHRHIYSRFWQECYDSVFGSPDGRALYEVPMFSSGLGFVRRDLLGQPGFHALFAESLRAQEDYHLFARLQRSGISVWMYQSIGALIETRSTLRGFLEQRYGYWLGSLALAELKDVPPRQFRKLQLSRLSRALLWTARIYIRARIAWERFRSGGSGA